MSNSYVRKMLRETFLEVADAIETGQFGKKVKVGLTLFGSEHGEPNLIEGAKIATSKNENLEVVLIGKSDCKEFEVVNAESEENAHKVMERLLDNGDIDACVTMHYSFPIGVSTVGRVVTPGTGKEMILATTTGTSAINRTEAMIKNGIYGIIAAKALGEKNPTIGILNVDSARTVERALRQINENGYKINFGESKRNDGGLIMRGNDLLTGSVDVMISDTLTGNILMKMFSSFTTGGSYESSGFGYGPGIGFDYNRLIFILSRASGSPVVAGAIEYAAELVKGGIKDVANEEFKKVKNAKIDDVINELTKEHHVKSSEEEIVTPQKQVVTATLSGIDIMDLEDATKILWKSGIYAESGMGCTGPIILVNEENLRKAADELVKNGYMAKDACPC